ncbi:Hypothetical_protein [Hexamita inflata]|uniref:Hypothetical_protein n=1 Tax=Hexamita inflata TaxID=28002 RepID=A0AA86U1M7_9EUKA|nr:Hypothetical protein HINF_LOCUS15468 [Hexamita inflata]
MNYIISCQVDLPGEVQLSLFVCSQFTAVCQLTWNYQMSHQLFLQFLKTSRISFITINNTGKNYYEHNSTASSCDTSDGNNAQTEFCLFSWSNFGNTRSRLICIQQTVYKRELIGVRKFIYVGMVKISLRTMWLERLIHKLFVAYNSLACIILSLCPSTIFG